MSQRERYLRWKASRTPEQIARIKEVQKAWRLRNRDRQLATQKKTRAKHRARRLEDTRRWRARNREHVARYNKLWRENNRQLHYECVRDWRTRNKARRNAGLRRRYRTDAKFRMLILLRGQLYRVLKRKLLLGHKSASILKLVGCSLGELLDWIQSQFTPGMNWSKWLAGEIHIDHKRPCAAFDLANPVEQKACFHFTNLQPLWAVDNLRKH